MQLLSHGIDVHCLSVTQKVHLHNYQVILQCSAVVSE